MAIRHQKDAGHRVPPNNVEAEQAIIGGVLLDPDAVGKVLEMLLPDGSDFYHPAHARLWRGMVSLFERNSPIDIVTLSELFRNTEDLAAVGGVSYIAAVLEAVPTAANIAYYARIVKEKSLLRRIISASTEVVARAYAGAESTEEFIDDAERMIYEVAQDRGKRSFYSLKELIKPTFETIERLSERKTHVTGVASGYTELDKLTSGLQDSDLIIIAGRPGMGKTSFALNIAENAAMDSGAPVAVFSLEMSKEQLAQRMLASRAKVGLQSIRNGRIRSDDWGRLSTSAGALSEAPIYIDDTPALTALDIRAKARRWKNELGLKLIIIDYLQLMRGRRSSDNREQEISEISRSLKALAKELHVPVIALSQLSRMTERRGEDKKPQLSDLRESGAIEQDADVVMFVYRESLYKQCECPKELCTCGLRRGAQILIAKQRNGPTGNIDLTFLYEFTRFENQTQGHEAQGEWVE
ncbi:MAG: replicative DNA helicase [Deltaproteobacteria bacterium]|nr:replicative DNA helicase [Deltaproteobacteria bacterium]